VVIERRRAPDEDEREEQVRSTSDNERVELVIRHFNVVINSRRCMAVKTRPEELWRAKSVGQSFGLDVCSEKPKPIAVDRSKKTGRRLCLGI